MFSVSPLIAAVCVGKVVAVVVTVMTVDLVVFVVLDEHHFTICVQCNCSAKV